MLTNNINYKKEIIMNDKIIIPPCPIGYDYNEWQKYYTYLAKEEEAKRIAEFRKTQIPIILTILAIILPGPCVILSLLLMSTGEKYASKLFFLSMFIVVLSTLLYFLFVIR
jgi:sterol desaturase/sphingolipid hydroxylase (fatty acid hydroxylase superfamily)